RHRVGAAVFSGPARWHCDCFATPQPAPARSPPEGPPMAAANEPANVTSPVDLTPQTPAPAPAADTRPEPGDRFALALWIGSMVLMALLTLCALLFTWLR